MMFEFFGTRRKVVIAMAHIGALPGTPLYDAAGGMDKLIEGVARDIEKLQAGGVHAIMFGNENDRPYRFAATPETVAGDDRRGDGAEAVAEGAVRGQLSLGPHAPRSRSPAPPARRFVREIFTGVCSPPTWASGSRTRRTR